MRILVHYNVAFHVRLLNQWAQNYLFILYTKYKHHDASIPVSGASRIIPFVHNNIRNLLQYSCGALVRDETSIVCICCWFDRK